MKKQYSKVINRFYNIFKNLDNDYIYLIESYKESNVDFINKLSFRITNNFSKLYIIISNDDKIDESKLSKNVHILYDTEKIFDSNKLEENKDKMCEFVKKHIFLSMKDVVDFLIKDAMDWNKGLKHFSWTHQKSFGFPGIGIPNNVGFINDYHDEFIEELKQRPDCIKSVKENFNEFIIEFDKRKTKYHFWLEKE